MEDQEEENQQNLVDKLSPALHQECAGDFASTVEAVLFCGNLSGPDSVLHPRSRRHRVLPADTNSVEEERPHIADNPAVLGDAPCSRQHDQTEEHDHGVLNEAEPPAHPITDNTNKNLTCTD